MRKIYIIGGSGFIGTNLYSQLLKNSSLSCFILDKVVSNYFTNDSKIADVRNIEELLEQIPYGAEIINLAAEHTDNVSPISLYHEVNVIGAQNICDVARIKNINKIIFTSSVAVYGFAPVGTDENGNIAPFNEYGKSKWEAEQVYKKWQEEDSQNRTLVIVRPTVVFGKRNRGNVFNLLKQIASGKFLMVGNGLNRKSLAYVENVSAFLEFSLMFKPGIHVYNYIDKPDFSMNQLVAHVHTLLNRQSRIKLRLPFVLGVAIGNVFDLIAFLFRKKFAISSIRVKKFCANSVFESAVDKTGFIPPVSLVEAIQRTVRYEFIESHDNEQVFYTE